MIDKENDIRILKEILKLNHRNKEIKNNCNGVFYYVLINFLEQHKEISVKDLIDNRKEYFKLLRLIKYVNQKRATIGNNKVMFYDKPVNFVYRYCDRRERRIHKKNRTRAFSFLRLED